MKRVLLAGYYGMCNTGDDALLAVSAWGARRVYGDVALHATASRIPSFPGSDRVQPVYPESQRFPGEARIRFLLSAALSQGVVFGGGSVFHDRANLRQKMQAVRLAGPGPNIAVGVSLGPFRSVRAERATAHLLEMLDFTGLRDKESADIARAIAPSARCTLTFDLAALLPAMAPTAPAEHRNPRTLGVAVCDYERFTGGDQSREAIRRRKLTAVLSKLDPSAVEEIVFVDFNGHPVYGDGPLHRELANAVPRGIRVRQTPYCSDPLAVLRLVRGMGALLAMRLHASIFAYVTCTPCVTLAYHPKCIGWARQIEAPSASVYDSAEFDPTEVSDTIYAALAGRLNSPGIPIPEAQRRALVNFPPLDTG